ncbi:MAG: hypothetical protein ACXWUG_10735 [Polyangiales bacterium]
MTEAKSKILARRARFLAAAAASAGIVACSSADDGTPTPSDSGGTDTGISTDTGMSTDTGPMPCLTPVEDTGVLDSGTDSTTDSASDTGADTGPMPCLAPPPGDSGAG